MVVFGTVQFLAALMLVSYLVTILHRRCKRRKCWGSTDSWGVVMQAENRRFPMLVGARFTEAEKAALGLAAITERVTVNEYVRRAVLPAVGRSLGRTLTAIASVPVG